MTPSIYRTYLMHVSQGVLDKAEDIATATGANGDVFIDIEQAEGNFPQDDSVYTKELREALNKASDADCEYLHLV